VDETARDCRPATPRRTLIVLAALTCALPAAAQQGVTPGPAPLSSAADAPRPADASPEAAYAEFKRLFEAGQHAAAVEQARKVVELAERDESAGAAGKEDLTVAVMNLGLAERTAGDYVAAESSYQRAIGLIEASGRLTSPRYARAYAGLALTYYDARRYDLAAPAFDKAIALNRRAEGLFNEEQLPLLEKQADSLTELGRAEEALQAHRYALRLVGRRSGERSLSYARELESFGRWYTRARAYDASRATLKRSAELFAELQGPEALELIGPLTAIAENARRWIYDPAARAQSAEDEERRAMYHDPVMPGPPSLSPSTIESEGLRALERAVAISDAHPDAPPATVAAVRLQLGDWYQARRAPERALPHYQQAWKAAAQVTENGRSLSEALFGAPLLLNFVAPEGWNRYAQRPPEEIERRDVEVEMTVTALGRVQGARVVADGGDARLASRGLRAAESGHYRPRLVDGVPVDTPGVRFVQPFFVLRAIPPGESPTAEAAEATGLDPTKPDEAARDAAPPETRAPGTDPPQGGG
jgi:tetratricopeptide (TPR) repeat protein